jgi:predicted nucleic acid-binding protein
VIFVDTWAWLALAHQRDPYHRLAVEEHRTLQKHKVRYVTTNDVLAELKTSLFPTVSFAKARQFMLNVFQSLHTGRYQLVFVSPEQFERAWQLRQRYHDKPKISFTDLTSMIVMQDLGITDVFTGDSHFQQVGLGFRLVPSRT